MEINKITLDKLTLHPDIPYETTDKSGNAGKVFGIVVTDRDHRVVFGWDHVLSKVLETKDVEVRIRGKHGCMTARGIQSRESFTETRVAGGIFADPRAPM